MTATLTAPQRRLTTVGRYMGPADLDGQFRMADRLAKGRKALHEMYHDSPGDVLATIYQAQALDVGVMTALQHFVWGDGGRGAMTGWLMSGLILRAGHTVEVLHADAQRVSMRLLRADDRPTGEAEWTIEEAAAAGIVTKSNWVRYPADMLWWRCLARLARRYAPDVVLGMGYVPEELEDEAPTEAADLDDAPVLEVAPDVAELLAGAAELDAKGLHKVWSKAYQTGVFSAYAGTHDGVRMTVEQYLMTLKAALLGRSLTDEVTVLEAAAEDAASAADTVVEELPAGVGVDACGCAVKDLIMSGGAHREDCRRAGPAPLPPPPAPVIDSPPIEPAPPAPPAGIQRRSVQRRNRRDRKGRK